MKKKKIVIVTSIALVVLIIVIGFGYVQSKLDKINKVPEAVDIIPPEQEDFEIDTSNEPQDIIELQKHRRHSNGYLNILRGSVHIDPAKTRA